MYSHGLGRHEDEAGWLIRDVFKSEVELRAAGRLLPIQGSGTFHESPIHCLVVQNSPLVVHLKPPPLGMSTCTVPIAGMSSEPQSSAPFPQIHERRLGSTGCLRAADSRPWQ